MTKQFKDTQAFKEVHKNPHDTVSPEVKLKHDRSVASFPELNLSPGEFIIFEVERHPIGLVPPLAVGALLMIVSVLGLINVNTLYESFSMPVGGADRGILVMILIFLVVMSAVGSYVAYYVFKRNRFFLTNESVIQEIQTSLFFRKEQTVSLRDIEDASYTQRGIIEYIFNYGAIRLSTEGDETTYRFSYVPRPKENIAILNNAVEDFKNGRTVKDED